MQELREEMEEMRAKRGHGVRGPTVQSVNVETINSKDEGENNQVSQEVRDAPNLAIPNGRGGGRNGRGGGEMGEEEGEVGVKMGMSQWGREMRTIVRRNG